MGKSVQITAFAQPRPGFVRIEIDRSLTGMGHETFDHSPGEDALRTVDELARQLFATGLVDRMHVFSNVITVESTIPQPASKHVARRAPVRATMVPEDVQRLTGSVEQFLIHYRPGVMPTPVSTVNT